MHLAQRTECRPRLVREWLDGQASGGLVAYDDKADSYMLSNEGAAVLADETQPTFVARSMNAIGSFFMDIEKVTAAFRGDGGVHSSSGGGPRDCEQAAHAADTELVAMGVDPGVPHRDSFAKYAVRYDTESWWQDGSRQGRHCVGSGSYWGRLARTAFATD